MEFFNFGPRFRDFVQTLLRNTQTCVSNNGFISNWFYQSKGTKQGCCISAALATCCIESFSHQICKNKKIKGIKIAEIEYKLIQFADDMNLPLKFEQETLTELVKELDLFERVMGLKVNYNKTSIYRIDALKNSNAQLYSRKPFTWKNNDIDILGINISHDNVQAERNNFYKILEKAEQVCKLWKHRKLSLIGKITVINSLIGSLFGNKLNVLNLLTESRIKGFEEGIKKFLWNGKKAKIKLETLYKDRHYRGLRLVSLRDKDIALKSQWVYFYSDFLKI